MAETQSNRSISEDHSRFVQELGGKTLEALGAVNQKMGELVHHLLSVDTYGRHGIIVDDGLAAGLVSHTLASHDGSSRYLVGGLVDYSGKTGKGGAASNDEIQSCFSLAEEAGIDSCTLAANCSGNTSGEQAGSITVKTAARGRESLLPQTHCVVEVGEERGSDRHRQAIQHAASILTLYQIIVTVIAENTHQQVFEALSSLPELPKKKRLVDPIEIVKNQECLSKAKSVEEFNLNIWKRLFPIVREIMGGDKLSIGESFTSGILAKVLTSLRGASKLFDKSLNWYDPKFKQWVGVPEENTSEALIAEPPTIALAVSGLLEKMKATSKFALGTTGWANYWIPGQPDYFSIGSADGRGEGSADVATAYVRVVHSKDAPRAEGRRQLTRHLGSTVALYMLTKALLKKGAGEKNQDLEEIQGELNSVIETYAEMTIKDDYSAEG